MEGDLDHPSADLLRRVVERDRYLLLRRDTVLPADFRANGDLVVLGAEVRLEGTVEGAVAVLDGGLFVRPGARIAGPVVTVGGGYYRSALASAGEALDVPLQAEARVEGDDNGFVVILLAPPGQPPIRLPGLLGLGLPTYDRVDGLTLRWGTAAHLRGDSIATTAGATVSYHSARGELGGRVALLHPLTADLRLELAGARRTATNESWIRGDLENSIATIGLHSDVRDYHRTDEASLTLARRPRQALIAGEGRVLPRLTVRASRDRSVAASDPWTLFGDEPWRPNPAIDEGTLASVVGGAEAERVGATTAFLGDAAVEWAPEGIGDFSFVQLVASGEWAAEALWRHRFELFAYTRQTLGGDAAPRQRWSFVGGSGTLSTLETARMRGDHVVYVESGYALPAPVKVPFLDAPEVRLEHRLGSAWVSGFEPPRWEQALGAGLDFGLLKAMLFVDPADDSPRPSFHLSAAFPF